MSPTMRAILGGGLIAAILDLGWAFMLAARDGIGPARVLRVVASGPFGDAMREGGAGASAVGACVHVLLALVMAAVFVLVARQAPALVRRPILWGLAYGFGLYVVMYWIVLPLRWPERFPNRDPYDVAAALFTHMVLVGVPIALAAARAFRAGAFRGRLR
ncbi:MULTISPECIES: hypothetical protein [Sphingomonas]|uniref:DUF1440 domain-containing protein n=1 Tax=Edaphosphingomonas fennica TaxID=114404 RepID=A0A2T4HPB2_9SPHN|nr:MULTISPECIES: hypothetical protein [Sphingomonas]AGH49141.1 hypothetical protein G432_07080 [Sphingomonas sp. MM-1]PTD17635.1 hypothetical protein CV103_16715 [Sphingomonas fennica]